MEKKPHLVASNEHDEEGTQGQPLWKKRKESPHPLDNQEPSAALGKKRLKLSRWIRFPDLLHKDVRRTDPETPATILCANAAADVQAWSVGEGGSTQGIRPVDFVDVRSVPIPKAHPAVTGWWWGVVAALADRLMMVYPTVQFIPLNPRQRFPQISTMPRMVNPDGEIHPLCLVKEKDHVRARHVAILRYAGEDNCGVVVFPEVVKMSGGGMEPAIVFRKWLDKFVIVDEGWLLNTFSYLLLRGSLNEDDMVRIESTDLADSMKVTDKMLDFCLPSQSEPTK